MKATLSFFSIFLLANLLVCAQTVTDFDGNVYNLVNIGTQTWMKENLKALHYSDGSAISGVYAYGNEESNVAAYGRLYNWNAAMKNSLLETAQGACPDGWHMPTVAEYDVLLNFLGGESVAGGKLKEAGTDHWISPNTGATDESGFTALPGGFYFNSSVGFLKLGEYAKFWTSSQVNGSETSAYNLYLRADQAEAHNETGNEKELGASVRCLQGQGALGIAPQKTGSSILVYPNPANNYVNISILKNTGSVHAELMDASGKTIMGANIDETSSKIDLSGLKNGVYFLKINSKEQSFTKKIVKL